MIRFVDETGSTNADLAETLRAGGTLAEGDWLVTRRQTAGKGRQGREWFDGAGNFMGSTVVELRESDPPASSLSFVVALAVSEAIEKHVGDAAEIRLKWPNDVLIKGAKASGILLQLVKSHVIVGIGVNLTSAPQVADRKTIAMSQIVAPPGVEEFTSTLADELAGLLQFWRRFGCGPIFQEFEEQSIHSPGSAITVHDTDGSRVSGTFAGLDQTDGALRLRLADGSERVIRAGDVA